MLFLSLLLFNVFYDDVSVVIVVVVVVVVVDKPMAIMLKTFLSSLGIMQRNM